PLEQIAAKLDLGRAWFQIQAHAHIFKRRSTDMAEFVERVTGDLEVARLRVPHRLHGSRITIPQLASRDQARALAVVFVLCHAPLVRPRTRRITPSVDSQADESHISKVIFGPETSTV